MQRVLIVLLLILPTDLALANQVAEGKAVFDEKCLPCHNSAGTGTIMLGKRLGEENALLSERRNLNAAYIKTVLRYGMGSMPWYRRTEISDAEADAIAAYLTRKNNNP